MVATVKFDAVGLQGVLLAKQIFFYNSKNKSQMWLVCAGVDTVVDDKVLTKLWKVPAGKLR